MSRPQVNEHNSETDEINIRDMNDLELKAYKDFQAAAEKAITDAAQAAADKAALLAKLGITADEAKLLLS